MVGAPVLRGEVYLITPEPTQGREIQKTRPCLIISPDELNAHLGTFIVAPLTTGSNPYPFRVPCRAAGKSGHVVLDQVRTVDRGRLVRRLTKVSAPTLSSVLTGLQEMFAP